jgi:NAD(P)-dependent dehydrogenase (short-subunit alcohol dehydrogenase family)
MSKCAAHIAARCLAADLQPHGIAVGVVHPGVVKTDMTLISGSATELEPGESARGVVDVARELSLESSGCFWNYRGEKLPW